MDQGTANATEVYLEIPTGLVGNLTSRITWDAPFAETREQDEGHLSPTIIFSPAFADLSCESYAGMLSELVSREYTVAALPRPYEQRHVLYHDGPWQRVLRPRHQ